MNDPIIDAAPWPFTQPPGRILAIRLQALGDVVITLPYLQHLRNRLGGTTIDFLTREEVADLPKGLRLFDNVFTLGGKRNFKMQALFTWLMIPRLLPRRYDIVIDLQANELSRWVTRSLRPAAWSAFDRTSPQLAGIRTQRTIEALNLGPVQRDAVALREDTGASRLLRQHGWQPGQELVVLNPAGGFPTRNWPLQNYAAFARIWLEENRNDAKFLVLGIDAMAEKARYLQEKLGGALINLVGMTTQRQAFALLQEAALVLSEDSGLMHMAWVAGAPTLALFGSSRSDWSAPMGDHTLCLGSGDLSCGECMAPTCRFGDVRCLTRYSPEFVSVQARTLIDRLAGKSTLFQSKTRP